MRRALRSSSTGGASPRSAARLRRRASASAWNVPAVTRPRTPSASRRRLSSAAALRVNVTAEDVRRIDASLLRAPRDPTGEDPGLARSGSGQDRQGRGRRGDGVALRRVEPVEERFGPGAEARRCHRRRRYRSPPLRRWTPGSPSPRPPNDGRIGERRKDRRATGGSESARGWSDGERPRKGEPRVVFAASQLRSPRGPSVPLPRARAAALAALALPTGSPFRITSSRPAVAPLPSGAFHRCAADARAGAPVLPVLRAGDAPQRTARCLRCFGDRRVGSGDRTHRRECRQGAFRLP